MSDMTVGRFSIRDGFLTGPADYWREQGQKKMQAILAGADEAFNRTSHLSPSVEMAILVHLQTDYAGWAGYRQMFGSEVAS